MAWLRSPTAAEAPDATGQAADLRHETISCRLPQPRITCYRENGAPIPARTRLHGRSLTGLALTGGELFIARLTPSK